MKALKSTLIIGLAIAIGVSSCDEIENPVVQNDTTLNWSLYPDSDTTTYPWPTWTTNSNTTRNVLLEDYTGHTCTNCPSAAAEAKAIEDANNGKVILVSVHASTTGGFQVPSPPHLPDDHRTDAGNEYATAMNISFNPAGTVNRTINSNNYFVFSSDWATSCATELVKAPEFNLQTAFNYYPSTRGLFFHTETEVLNDVSGDYNIINLLVRDTLIAPQEDQGGVTLHHYDHHAILTDDINGTWGTPIITGGSNSGDKIYNNFSVELPDATTDTSFWVKNLSIITFISNRDNYEVMQVIKTPLFE